MRFGSESDHPWARFLAARHQAIHWLVSNGDSFGKIAKTLSMDPVQVRMISEVPLPYVRKPFTIGRPKGKKR